MMNIIQNESDEDAFEGIEDKLSHLEEDKNESEKTLKHHSKGFQSEGKMFRQSNKLFEYNAFQNSGKKTLNVSKGKITNDQMNRIQDANTFLGSRSF